jgi:hypothetical protein
MTVAKRIIVLAALVIAQLSYAQNQNEGISIGENTKLKAGGLLSFGYAGDYGTDIPSSHGFNGGIDGKLSGYYYNPNFLSFEATPYYNQSRNNSTYQSLTGAEGIETSANLFAGSHFPGSVAYHYDRNSTGLNGVAGQPNFTTIGKGQGFSVNWSALLPDLPTLSVGYSQGSGSGTIFGTNEETSSKTKLLNIRSDYSIVGFRLNSFFTHNVFRSAFPEFLSGQSESLQDSSSNNVGVGAQHALPLHGQFYANYTRTSSDSSYFSGSGQATNSSNYVDNIENAGASFHPTQKLSLNFAENYTSNLSGYLAQSLSPNGPPVPGVNLGTGSHSTTLTGGAGYQFTNYLAGSVNATHYDQFYFGNDYTGTFISGNLACSRKLLNTFSFSGSVVDSTRADGDNALGFITNVNAFRRVKGWQLSGNFSYAQNVQTLLVTYTTSYYNYSANARRRLSQGLNWVAAFNGTHSGIQQYQGSTSHSEGYSTSLGMRTLTITANYTNSSGVSLMGSSVLVPINPTPGLNTNFVTFSGSSWGGGLSITPIRRLVLSGAFSRAISHTDGSAVFSQNDNEIFNAQMQYHIRRIGLQAGYTRFTQGISAVGLPATSSSYFVGFTRWFDFF